jgi:hypothetical protein
MGDFCVIYSMKRLWIIFSLLFFFSCEKEDPVCITSDCQGHFFLDYEQDSNGYYHVPLDWTGQYLPRFNIYIEGSKTSYKCQAAGNSIIYAYFDTDTYWALDENFAITIPLYNPWIGPYTDPNGNRPISTRDTTIVLSQFKGTLVPVVQQNARIMLKEYFPGSNYRSSDEFKPTDPEEYYWSKRIVGPIHPGLKSDTASIYMQMIWDCGSDTETKNYGPVKIIFE